MEYFAVVRIDLQFFSIIGFNLGNFRLQAIAHPILCDIFSVRSIDYNLRSQTDFSVSSVNTTHFGLNSLRYFASKIWNMVPLELKNLNDVESFKSEIRKWEPMQCECTLCLPYMHSIGYVNISNN